LNTLSISQGEETHTTPVLKVTLRQSGGNKMSKPGESNIAASFLNIHNIISRGLKVSMESVREGIQHGLQDGSRREGLFNYIHALCSVLNSHHLTEDELAFPYFRDKLPGAPFDVLIRWHEEMVEILEEIKLALEKCEKGEHLQSNLGDLADALTRLNESWQPHIQMETEEFISKADALIPVEEQLRLVRQFAEHGTKIAVPHFLTVPFLLFNLPREDRQVFSKDMPAEVLQHLVPVVWKEKWESMRPFFLA
jgi:hemerythrin-like domain-containing protein